MPKADKAAALDVDMLDTELVWLAQVQIGKLRLGRSSEISN